LVCSAGPVLLADFFGDYRRILGFGNFFKPTVESVESFFLFYYLAGNVVNVF